MHHTTDGISHTTAFVTPVVEHWLEREIAQWVHHEGSIRRPIAPLANALTTVLHHAPDRERERKPVGLLLSISSKGSFICIIPQDNTYHGLCYTSRGALAKYGKMKFKHRTVYNKNRSTQFCSAICRHQRVN